MSGKKLTRHLIRHEIGKIYPMAVCPRYRVLTLVLKSRLESLEAGIGWWHCHLCLEWHIYLTEEQGSTEPNGR